MRLIDVQSETTCTIFHSPPAQTVRLIDVQSETTCSIFRGHLGSVKSVAQWGGASPSLLASGARDGAVLLWDARAVRGRRMREGQLLFLLR